MTTAARITPPQSGFARGIGALLWVGVLAGSILGTAILILSFGGSAPQEAAAAGIAACLGVLPYVAARAWDALRSY